MLRNIKNRKIDMKFINEIKALMYSKEVTHDVAFKLNDIIYEYDAYRARNENERVNAGKEWEYRLKRMCDYRVKL